MTFALADFWPVVATCRGRTFVEQVVGVVAGLRSVGVAAIEIIVAYFHQSLTGVFRRGVVFDKLVESGEALFAVAALKFAQGKIKLGFLAERGVGRQSCHVTKLVDSPNVVLRLIHQFATGEIALSTCVSQSRLCA